MNDFVVIASDAMPAHGIAACVDLLHLARANAADSAAPLLNWRVCSAFGGRVALQGGFVVDTDAPHHNGPPDGHERIGANSCWLVPDLGLNTKADVLAYRDRPEPRCLAPLLRAHLAAGGRVAASGSGIFLLQFAGVLNARRVAVARRWAGLLHGMNPSCRIDAALSLCTDGNLVTAAAAFSQAEVMIQLLRARSGERLADALCRDVMPPPADAPRAAVVGERTATDGHALVSRIVARVEGSLPSVPTVAALAQDFCVSRRTLGRHVRRVTGESTHALLQDVRLRRARVLLEQSHMPVDQVAAAVGYEDSTALRRLMRKRCGVSPRHYRPDARPVAAMAGAEE